MSFREYLEESVKINDLDYTNTHGSARPKGSYIFAVDKNSKDYLDSDKRGDTWMSGQYGTYAQNKKEATKWAQEKGYKMIYVLT